MKTLNSLVNLMLGLINVGGIARIIYLLIQAQVDSDSSDGINKRIRFILKIMIIATCILPLKKGGIILFSMRKENLWREKVRTGCMCR